MPALLRVVSLVVVLALHGVVGAPLAGAQDWTRFRGPNGSGVSDADTVPTRWTDNDYNWKVSLPGIGHSSPVIWGDKIFLISAFDDTATRLVLCLRATDGQIEWQREYTSTPHTKHQLNSFASSTPCVDEERVYVTWTAPEEFTLLALDHEGNEVWRRNLGPFVSQHSGGASPVDAQARGTVRRRQEPTHALAARPARARLPDLADDPHLTP